MTFFCGKVAVITGGASGIGRAIGQQLASEGAVVVLVDIDEPLLEKTTADIIAAGGVAHEKVADVTDAAAVRGLVDEVCDEHGRIDYMFNNAGIALFGEARDMTFGQWTRMIDVNLNGVVYGVYAAYAKMVDQGFGHIISTASLAGLTPQPGLTAYAMTKHAVVGLSTSLRAEAERYGVKVSVLCPGLIDTPLKDNLTYLKLDKKRILADKTLSLAPVEHCARVTLTGVRRNRAIITVTAAAKVAWWAYRFAPNFVVSWLGPRIYRYARKKFATDDGDPS